MAAGKVVISVTPELDPYYPVQEIRVSIEVRDANDDLTDPGTLTLFVRKPDGSEYQILIGAMVHDSLGRYHYDALLDMSYSWRLRAEASGPVASDEFPITVAGSIFDTAVDPPVGPGTGHEGEIARVTGGVYQPYAGDANGKPLVWNSGTGWTSTTMAPQYIQGGTNGFVLTTVAGVATWQSLGTLGASPGGGADEVQYNNGGVFNGAASVKIAGVGSTEHGLRFFENGGWGGTPPTAGALNFLSNSNMMVLRNAADSANIVLMATGTTDILRFGAAGLLGIQYNVSSSSLHTFQHNGTDEYTFSSTIASFKDNAISFGATPADAGTVRLSNNQGLFARNVGNTANIRLLALTVGNTVLVGDQNSSTLSLDAGTSTDLNFSGGANPEYSFNTTGITMNGNNVVGAGFFSGTGTVSTVGLLRGAHGINAISVRNNANTLDAQIVNWGIDGTDILGLGRDTAVASVFYRANAEHRWHLAGNQRLSLTTSTLALTTANLTLDSGVISQGTTPATAGLWRVPHNPGVGILSGRNQANSANIDIIRWGIVANDRITFGSSSVSGIFSVVATGGSHVLQVNAADEYNFTSTELTMNANNIVGAGFFSTSGNTATTGALRLTNNTGIFERNAANSANIKLIALDNSDVVTIGDTTVAGMTFAISNGFTYNFTTSSGTGGISIGNSSMSLFFGGTVASGSGDVRVRQGFSIVGRNNANSGDQNILDYGSSADRLLIGNTVGSLLFGNVNTAFFGGTPAAKQTVSGSRAANAALASLLTALATYGLLTDSSTI